jgi:hypothetical protein
MIPRKQTNSFYFTVEGETEKWYFSWLQDTINNAAERTSNAKIIAKVQTPRQFLKSASFLTEIEVIHVFDYEADDNMHIQRFEKTLCEMKSASQSGKNIVYKSGYSNFDFELWIILHKGDCFGALSDKKQYLDKINRLYKEQFQGLREYKEENNFRRILSRLTLSDVNDAVKRAECILEQRKKTCTEMKKYGYTWYRENPSMLLYESVKKILTSCKVRI